MKDNKLVWRDNLTEKYPELMECYPEIDQGWENILDHMLARIRHHTKWVKDVPETKIVQVKEKFGTLRVNHIGGDDTVRGIIIMAESMSHCMCEQCGCPGEATDNSWIKTLCHNCSGSFAQTR